MPLFSPGVVSFNARSGAVTLIAGDVSGVGGILNGGNSFGAALAIGTNDNNTLGLRFNNQQFGLFQAQLNNEVAANNGWVWNFTNPYATNLATAFFRIVASGDTSQEQNVGYRWIWGGGTLNPARNLYFNESTGQWNRDNTAAFGCTTEYGSADVAEFTIPSGANPISFLIPSWTIEPDTGVSGFSIVVSGLRTRHGAYTSTAALGTTPLAQLEVWAGLMAQNRVYPAGTGGAAQATNLRAAYFVGDTGLNANIQEWVRGDTLASVAQMGPTGVLTAVAPVIRCTNSTALTVATATATVLTWDTEQFKTVASMHSTTVNTSRFVAPVTGKYRLQVTIHYSTSVTSGDNIAYYGINGGANVQMIVTHNGASGRSEATGSDIVALNANDYIEFKAFQDSGSTQTLTNGPGDLTTAGIMEFVSL